ncbi:MAG: HPr family phosphocarrier protein [Lentisphaeria bacterium]|nr:HPr family phosphocarrier protein [Lentisphaeria bacterium]
MESKTVIIRNKAGIHCRPSSAIMTVAAKFPGHEFAATSSRGKVNLNSILDLLSMGLQKGDEVTIEVNGPNEKEACEKLAELFATEFDFV